VSDTLSQDEVSALLRGLSDGELGAAEMPPPADPVRVYDLTGDERFAGRRFEALDLAQERFVRHLRRTLAGFIGSPPKVEPRRHEFLKFGTFRNRLASSSSLHLFGMAPLRGQGLLAVAPPLAFALIDRVFGGSGRPPATLAAREYSPIETQMLQRVAAGVLADLAEAWAPLHRVSCSLGRCEINPASVAITGPAETVLVLSVHCDVGTEPASLTVALPFAMLEPLRDKLGEPETVSSGPDGEWTEVVTAAVRDAAVTVAAELGAVEISARDLLRLRVGDVLTLPTRADDPLALCVEGVRLLAGLPGVSRGNNAVRVVGRE